MKIEDLNADNPSWIEQAAALLVDYSPNRAAAWPDLEAAYETIDDLLEDEESVACVALNDAGNVIGFAGASPRYTHAWELHPVVVNRDDQRRGVGRALVEAVEERVGEDGGLTLYLGADDLDGNTSAAREDLFPGVLDHALKVEAKSRRHPLGFFRQLGYEVIGIIPDAHGPGQPDVWMARSLADDGPYDDDEEENDDPDKRPSPDDGDDD